MLRVLRKAENVHTASKRWHRMRLRPKVLRSRIVAALQPGNHGPWIVQLREQFHVAASECSSLAKESCSEQVRTRAFCLQLFKLTPNQSPEEEKLAREVSRLVRLAEKGQQRRNARSLSTKDVSASTNRLELREEGAITQRGGLRFDSFFGREIYRGSMARLRGSGARGA